MSYWKLILSDNLLLILLTITSALQFRMLSETLQAVNDHLFFFFFPECLTTNF